MYSFDPDVSADFFTCQHSSKMMIQTETKRLAFNLFVLGILENNGVALKAKRIWILEVSCVSFKHIVQCFDQKALENSCFFFVSFLSPAQSKQDLHRGSFPFGSQGSGVVPIQLSVGKCTTIP